MSAPLTARLLQLPNADHVDELRARVDEGVRVLNGDDPADPARDEVLVAGRPTEADLDARPRLRALVIPWTGLPPETCALARARPGLEVYNLHHNAIPVSEMALALLLGASQRIVPMDRRLRAGDWRPRYEPNPAILLHGRTALVLGYGAIGRRVARLCRALGMSVLATRRSQVEPEDDGVAAIHPPSALPDLLPRAHAVIVCLPLTEETRGLLGQREFGRLPAHAVLVNVGRGEVVEEEALYRALTEGPLGAAGLDVWYHYPQDEAARAHTPPSRFPFHELDHVVLSPHRAGGVHTLETERLRVEALAALFNALACGQDPPNRVDVGRGY